MMEGCGLDICGSGQGK